MNVEKVHTVRKSILTMPVSRLPTDLQNAKQPTTNLPISVRLTAFTKHTQRNFTQTKTSHRSS